MLEPSSPSPACSPAAFASCASAAWVCDARSAISPYSPAITACSMRCFSLEAACSASATAAAAATALTSVETIAPTHTATLCWTNGSKA